MCCPRDAALLITRLRPTGLKVVSQPRFSTGSENPFLGVQSLSLFHVFANVALLDRAEVHDSFNTFTFLYAAV